MLVILLKNKYLSINKNMSYKKTEPEEKGFFEKVKKQLKNFGKAPKIKLKTW